MSQLQERQKKPKNVLVKIFRGDTDGKRGSERKKQMFKITVFIFFLVFTCDHRKKNVIYGTLHMQFFASLPWHLLHPWHTLVHLLVVEATRLGCTTTAEVVDMMVVRVLAREAWLEIAEFFFFFCYYFYFLLETGAKKKKLNESLNQ